MTATIHCTVVPRDFLRVDRTNHRYFGYVECKDAKVREDLRFSSGQRSALMFAVSRQRQLGV
jgi:hypothetical protein